MESSYRLTECKSFCKRNTQCASTHHSYTHKYRHTHNLWSRKWSSQVLNLDTVGWFGRLAGSELLPPACLLYSCPSAAMGWRGPLANCCLGDVSVDSAVASSSAVAPCHEKVLESCSLKGHRFESLQEWQENFLLQGQLSVLLFGHPFHPWVTTLACKRLVILPKVQGAKHVCTLCMWLCMKWHGAWLYGVHRTLWNSSSFMWRQPCQRCKYTTLVDIQKCTVKS